MPQFRQTTLVFKEPSERRKALAKRLVEKEKVKEKLKSSQTRLEEYLWDRQGAQLFHKDVCTYLDRCDFHGLYARLPHYFRLYYQYLISWPTLVAGYKLMCDALIQHPPHWQWWNATLLTEAQTTLYRNDLYKLIASYTSQ